MGGLKKPKTATPQSGTEKGKEIRIVTRHVITISEVEKNPRLLKLLYVISLAKNGISEKGLAHILHYMMGSGVNLGYKFSIIGGVPTSRDLLNDLVALKYTGLVEVLANKKLQVTGQGKELLEKIVSNMAGDFEVIKKAFEENWPKVVPIDVEVSLRAQKPSSR